MCRGTCPGLRGVPLRGLVFVNLKQPILEMHYKLDCTAVKGYSELGTALKVHRECIERIQCIYRLLGFSPPHYVHPTVFECRVPRALLRLLVWDQL